MLNYLLHLLNDLFCQHDYEFVRNTYGDEIIMWDWDRSIWRCSKCGKRTSRAELHEVSHVSIDKGI